MANRCGARYGSFPMSNEPDKIIYSMIGVSKRYDRKIILKDISLSYFYGAKIGVLGLNGAGKSSLLKILAGVDKNFEGKTVVAPGYTCRLPRAGAPPRRNQNRPPDRRTGHAG